MKRPLQIIIVTIISITLGSSAQAYVDARGFSTQGSVLTNTLPGGVNPQRQQERHHRARSITIINQYNNYPVIYDDGDEYDYPNDGY